VPPRGRRRGGARSGARTPATTESASIRVRRVRAKASRRVRENGGGAEIRVTAEEEEELRRLVLERGGWRREERTSNALEQRSARSSGSGPGFCTSFSMPPCRRLLEASSIPIRVAVPFPESLADWGGMTEACLVIVICEFWGKGFRASPTDASKLPRQINHRFIVWESLYAFSVGAENCRGAEIFCPAHAFVPSCAAKLPLWLPRALFNTTRARS
jgi:hypothetical protein